MLDSQNDWETSYHSLYKEAQILLSRSALAESDVQHLTSLNLRLVSPKSEITTTASEQSNHFFSSNFNYLNSERVSYLTRIHSERDEARQALIRLAVEKDELENSNLALKKELNLFKSFKSSERQEIHRIKVVRKDPRAMKLSMSRGRNEGGSKLGSSLSAANSHKSQKVETEEREENHFLARTIGPGVQIVVEEEERQVELGLPSSSNSSPSLLQPPATTSSSTSFHPIQSTPVQSSSQLQRQDVIPPRRRNQQSKKGRRSSLLIGLGRRSIEKVERGEGWTNSDANEDDDMTLEELTR